MDSKIILLDDIRKVIVEECVMEVDFIIDGCIIRSGSIYNFEEPYPPSHYIEEAVND